MYLNTFWGLIIPFAGTTLGAGMVFFYEKKYGNQSGKIPSGLCIGSDDRSFCLVTAHAVY